ncbi:MAG TPA: hypothetical protein VFT55_12130, partial [Planctomycetota bacterium]|nr:hypothetical protein [Planctomycetota bacterium]
LLQQPATAFTAAFLLGAACLPVAVNGTHVETAFGTFPRPAGEHGDLRLVVLPGEVRAEAAAADRAGPTARVLATTPEPGGYRVRAALGQQMLVATAATPLPVGSNARLSLARPARLLPWQRRTASEGS